MQCLGRGHQPEKLPNKQGFIFTRHRKALPYLGIKPETFLLWGEC